MSGFSVGGSGYSLSFSSRAVITPGDYNAGEHAGDGKPPAAYVSDLGGVIVSIRDKTNNNYHSTYLVKSAVATTNLNTGNFAGFANNSIGSGGSVTINVVGATTSWTASSLTPGTGYFVQADGTLGTTADALSGSVSAGLALTSSSLLIK